MELEKDMDDRPAATDRSPVEEERFVGQMVEIGETLGRLRMLIGRRMIARTAIANTVPGLELSHLDVLDVMVRIAGEVTVGAIAEGMRIDPSRGSRLIAELVDHGVLRRVASQADGRRSLLVRTALGDRLLAERRAVKMALLTEVLGEWDNEELERFSAMFDKFVLRFEAAATQRSGESARS